ncbi:MAG: Flp pilus assembly protein CpaB [Gemmatimonadales bacterium]|jgi:pilus assembly protein CpaB
MNEKGFTGVFLSALLIGGVAAFSVYKLVIQDRAITVGEKIETVEVVVAAEDITEGKSLTETDLKTKRFTAEAVPAGAFLDADSLYGRVSMMPIFAGEPVMENKLAPIGSSAGLEVKIQPGMRAMAIPVNDHVGISGFIVPNSRVDVLVTIRPQRGQQEQTAKVFLQNMRVLTAGQHLTRDANGKPITASTVTLEVTPEEAELLAVAMHEGILQLALRGYADADSLKTDGATFRDVLAAAKTYRPPVRRRTTPQPQPKPTPPPEPVVQEPATAKVQVFRGTKMSEETVEVQDSAAVADTTKAKTGGGGGSQ